MYYNFTSPFSLFCCFFFCQGFLKLSMWLYLDPKNMEEDFKLTDNGHAEEHMLEVSPAGETHGCSPGGYTVDLRSVGQVEISDEATLEDLKTQVKHVDYACIGLIVIYTSWVILKDPKLIPS